MKLILLAYEQKQFDWISNHSKVHLYDKDKYFNNHKRDCTYYSDLRLSLSSCRSCSKPNPSFERNAPTIKFLPKTLKFTKERIFQLQGLISVSYRITLAVFATFLCHTAGHPSPRGHGLLWRWRQQIQ